MGLQSSGSEILTISSPPLITFVILRVIIRKNWILDTDIGTPENCNQLEVGISLTAMLLQTDQSSQCPHTILSRQFYFDSICQHFISNRMTLLNAQATCLHNRHIVSRSNPRADQKLSLSVGNDKGGIIIAQVQLKL